MKNAGQIFWIYASLPTTTPPQLKRLRALGSTIASTQLTNLLQASEITYHRKSAENNETDK